MDSENLYDKALRISERIIGLISGREAKDDMIKDWAANNSSAGEVIGNLTNPELLRRNIEGFVHPEKNREFQLLQKRILRRRRRRRIDLWSGVAAVLVLFIGVSVFFLGEDSAVKQAEMVDEHAPRLILGNGQQLNLNSLSGEWTENNGVKIKSEGEKGIVYFAGEERKAFPEKEIMNTLIVPGQCNYQVVLSDGTIVYMNADSRLVYPAEFIGNERKVKLEGEAYFEVAKDVKSFLVDVRGVEIKVYGTKFNIDAYHKDEIKTVLLEGQVGVTWQDEERILQPGQLSAVNKTTGEHAVRKVEIIKYVSWVKGYLRYDNDPLEQMVEDLSRWYGVDFEFHTESMKSDRITASINRDLPLETVLEMLRTTVNVTFIKKGRGYVIKQ